MPPSASRRSSRSRTWAPASCSRRTTWRSAAPANSSAKQQSGELTEVGLSCTSRCSSTRSSALRAGREPALERPLAAVSEIELHVPALLPEDYVPDVHLRLALYQRIAAADAAALAGHDRRADRPLRPAARRRPQQPAAAGRPAAARARAGRAPARARAARAAACSSRSRTASMPARVIGLIQRHGAGVPARRAAEAAHHARAAQARAALRVRAATAAAARRQRA